MWFSENGRNVRLVLLKFGGVGGPGGNAGPHVRLHNLGGHKAVVRPVPIPNTAVKHSLANGVVV